MKTNSSSVSANFDHAQLSCPDCRSCDEHRQEGNPKSSDGSIAKQVAVVDSDLGADRIGAVTGLACRRIVPARLARQNRDGVGRRATVRASGENRNAVGAVRGLR
jgi:hypothetical protein